MIGEQEVALSGEEVDIAGMFMLYFIVCVRVVFS